MEKAKTPSFPQNIVVIKRARNRHPLFITWSYTMNQKDLIDSIQHIANTTFERNVSKADITAVLDALADIAMHELGTENGEIPLPGLGKLKADVRAARTGRNPATGESMDIPAKNVVKFVAAKALKDALA